MRRVLAVLILGIACIGSEAGDKKKEFTPPKVSLGPEHKVLETFVGEWDAKVTMFVSPTKTIESKGVLTRKMILDGHYLQESFTGTLFGSKINGMAIVGFDQNEQKFFTIWIDSLSTNAIYLKGDYNPLKKTLTLIGTDFEPNEKKKMKARDVLRITGPDTQVFEMYRQPQGAPEEFKAMEVYYTRRKSDK